MGGSLNGGYEGKGGCTEGEGRGIKGGGGEMKDSAGYEAISKELE